jgi:hypothetical protein
MLQVQAGAGCFKRWTGLQEGRAVCDPVVSGVGLASEVARRVFV